MFRFTAFRQERVVDRPGRPVRVGGGAAATPLAPSWWSHPLPDVRLLSGSAGALGLENVRAIQLPGAPRTAKSACAADQALMDSLGDEESASTITLSRGRSTTIFRGLALSATGIRSCSTPS